MPVITAYLDDSVDVERVLPRLASAVADALNLPDEAVHAMHVPVSRAVTGNAWVRPWPTVLLHGGRRPDDAMAAALDGARLVLAQQCGRDAEHVWAQWILTE